MEESILDLIIGYQKSKALATAIQLDIFTKLDMGESIEINHRVRALLDALVKMGLLAYDNGDYKNTPASKTLFSRNSPLNICDFVLHNAVNLYQIWEKAYDAIKENKPVIPYTHDLDVRYYIFGLSALAPEGFPFLDKIRKPKKILDVGCGGLWASILFRRVFPDARIVAVDRLDVCLLVDKLAEKYKIELKPVSDYVTVDLEEKFDLVFVSEVIHGKSPLEATRLLEKCYNDLKKEGVVVVREYLKDSLYRALFNLNLALCTKYGQVYDFIMIEILLRTVGFDSVIEVEDNDPLGRGYVIGYKRR